MTNAPAAACCIMRIARLRWLLLLFTLAAVAPHAIAADATGGRFEDAAGWSSRFDGPGRESWQKPDEVIRALALAPNAVVVDIGSGTGYFSARLARALPRGRVYGSDIEPEMVRFLEQRAAEEKLGNLIATQATRDGPALPEPVDLALLVNVQGLVIDPGDYFARLRASLKPGGRVAIIAQRLEAPFGPPAGMRAPAAQIQRDMVRQGYTLETEHDFLPYQYFLVFRQ